MAACITGFEDYGISEKQLYRLGKRKVGVEVHLPDPPYLLFGKTLFKSLLRKSPAARRKLLYEWFDKKLMRIGKRSPLTDRKLKPFLWKGTNRYPAIVGWGVRVSLPAKDLKELVGLKEVESLTIERISGMRRRRRSSRREPSWYAVKGRFAWAVEGQTKGLQRFEDRTIVLKARSEKEAKKLARREFRDYAHDTLLDTGFFHRLMFEKLLDIYEMLDAELSPKGTEVFSTLRKRRMKPEFVWDPKREGSRKGQRRPA